MNNYLFLLGTRAASYRQTTLLHVWSASWALSLDLALKVSLVVAEGSFWPRLRDHGMLHLTEPGGQSQQFQRGIWGLEEAVERVGEPSKK
jgi:hypothetical protein